MSDITIEIKGPKEIGKTAVFSLIFWILKIQGFNIIYDWEAEILPPGEVSEYLDDSIPSVRIKLT